MTENKPVGEVKHPNIYVAFSAFQGELKPIEQSATVEFMAGGRKVSFTYAPLGKIMEFLYPLLSKHGLSVRHVLDDGTVECVLSHTSNEDMRSGKLPVDLKDSDKKKVGAELTYARRYTLGLVLGLSTEEDKDTELLEKSTKNLAAFAFRQAKENLSKAEGTEKERQLKFLEKELKLAEELEAGTGKNAPALGLSVAQYKELLILAKGQKVATPITPTSVTEDEGRDDEGFEEYQNKNV